MAAPFKLVALLAILFSVLDKGSLLHASEEDFAFEQEGVPVNRPTPVRRHWGVQDSVATAGKLFRLPVPVNAFKGDIDHYEAEGPGGSSLPSWLLFDKTAGLFEGVPSLRDVGEVYVLIRAVAPHSSAKDKFVIDVMAPRTDSAPSAGVIPIGLATHHHPKVKCGPGEDSTTVSVVMDVKYDHMKPRQRVATIDNLSGFLSLSHDLFQLIPHANHEDILGEDTVVMAGEGNVVKPNWLQWSAVQWQVGCDGKIWPQHAGAVQDLKQQARDGTLAEVLRWPVIGWHIKTTNAGSNALRGRREINNQPESGSGNYGEDDTEGGEVGVASVPEVRVVPTMSSPVYPEATATPAGTHTPDLTSNHPHRHHHGDLDRESISLEVDNNVEELSGARLVPDQGPLAPYVSSSFGGYHVPSSPAIYASIMPTPTLELEKPSIIQTVTTGASTPQDVMRSFEDLEVTPTPVMPTEMEATAYPSPSTPTSPGTSSGTTAGSPVYSVTSGNPGTSTDHSTTHAADSISEVASSIGIGTTTNFNENTSEANEPQISTEKAVTLVDFPPYPPYDPDYDSNNLTTANHVTTSVSRATSPPVLTTTELIEEEQKNFRPEIRNRAPKLHVTAGKILTYTVPDDMFADFEDGNTRNLKLSLKNSNGEELSLTSWIQFFAARREILILPLEEHVSKWFFMLEATDKDNESVSDKLEVIVQHHKGRRTVNHEITFVMEPTPLLRKQSVLLWEMALVESLARLFKSDPSQITVRGLDLDQLNSGGPISFTYTNDSIPRTGICPHEDIDKMIKMLRTNEAGLPSQVLIEALGMHANHLNIKSVKYRGLGDCESPSSPDFSPTKPNLENLPPIPRNQVDHINATVGQLLTYKVAADAFYDPEDGGANNMKLSLLTIDSSPIPSDNWLQFDVKNQEFYGIPMPEDEGSREYHLVCEDHKGLRARDVLVVVVHAAPHLNYSAEFSITIQPPYETFIHDAGKKRKFVEKLRNLFGDPDTSAIVIGRIQRGSTVVNWFNRTLPTTFCPDSEILRLRRVLVIADSTISPQVHSIMRPEFDVTSVGLYPIGICQGELTPLHPTEPPPPPVDESMPIGTNEEYLVTFVVPVVIICTMLLLAGMVACLLYRRRRTGKMSVGDEDERQSIRHKGIPVIFQDELEERPEPANKSPVIMKDEKPPLPPPEYQRHNSSPPPTATQALLSDVEDTDAEPYQPPPPFTTSRDTARHTRHKSTPSYRKPPPYVPP